jgi:hypothetical protein
MRHDFRFEPVQVMEFDMRTRFISLATVCMIVPVVLIAQTAEKKQLAGVWEVKVSPVGQSGSPLLSLAIFSRDGSFTTSVGYRALPPVRAVEDVATEIGPGYGHWAAAAAREFQLTFYSVMWKEGLVNGYQRVQDTLILSEAGDEYTGHAQVDFLDRNWNVVFSTASDVKATRLESPISATLVAQPGGEKQLAGVWEDKVSPTEQWGLPLPLLSLAMYGGGGDFITTGGYKALPPVAAVQDVANEVGLGFGRWVATGSREFRLTFYSVMGKTGLVNGFQRVQDTLVFSESGNEYAGHANVDFLDANRKIVFSTTSDVKGTRLETSIPVMPDTQLPKRTGVWELKAQPVGGAVPPIYGLLLFCGDGSFVQIVNSTLPPMPALQVVATELGSGFGQWAVTGARADWVIFYAVLRKAGLVNGFQRVQSAEVFSETGDEVSGRAQVEFFDRNWNSVLRVTSDSKSKRLETSGQD